MPRRRLLIVTRHTPLPWEDGAGAYLHDIARHLAASGFTVSILWLAPHDHLRWQKIWTLPAAFSPSVALHLPGAIRLSRRRYFFPAVLWQPFRARLLDRVRRLLSPLGLFRRRSGNSTTNTPVAPAAAPAAWATPPTPAELATIRRFASAQRPDVVIANYAWMCPALAVPSLRSALPVCLTHDIGWRRAELSAAPEFTQRDEAAWLLPARVLIAISADDVHELHLLAPHAHVVLAPKAINPSPSAPAPASASERHRLLFVGSDNPFNAEGLTWFLREVWPDVRRLFPAAALDVCGSISRLIHERPDGVAFHGVVSSLDSHYARTALVIVPLLRATGLNIKLVEAVAAGRAVVTTPVTLHGAQFLRDAVAVAESPAGFTAAIRYLLDHPAACATQAARALTVVREHLAPAACYDPLVETLS